MSRRLCQGWGVPLFDPPIAPVRAVVTAALSEDLVPLGDLTSALLPVEAQADARLVVRQPGVVAGRSCVDETFAQVDAAIACRWRVADGDTVGAGTVLADIGGPLASVLTAERTALNFLGHLSGIATLTAAFVDAAGGRLRVWDTRKTTPGLRALEKAAVRAGGGFNHRANLSDAIMVKDNHLAGLSIAEAVERARSMWPGRPVHVECDTMSQLDAILATRADRAMVDNFSPSDVVAAVALVADRIELEVTGGVTLDNVADYAAARPDFISVGALTQSAGVVDLGLDIAR